MNSRKFVVACAFALALTSSIVGVADTQEDHVVVLRQALTLEQVVKRELRSHRFAKQIASYNGVSISDVLPVGTSLRIPEPYMAERDFGRVAFVKGDVIHTQKDLVVNPPAKGAMILQGDKLTTGEDGFISITFNSGATVNLQPASKVAIVEVDCVDETVKCVISLNAEIGEMHSEVTPRPEGQQPVSFKVNTPFLSAAVRGTAFYVNVESGADRVGVTQGSVAANAGGVANDLPSGKGLLAVAGIEPSVVDLLPAPVVSLNDDRMVLSSEDKVTWATLDGATQYRATVASDEALTSPITTDEFQATSFQPNLSEPGQYYLALAGIDDQKFTGLPTVVDFQYASIDDTQQLQLQVERLGNLVQIAESDYDGTIELLLSNSIDSDNVTRSFITITDSIELELDPQQDWVFQARKVLGDNSVSTYSNQYLLEAIE